MNILVLSPSKIESYLEGNIYSGLVWQFISQGHTITAMFIDSNSLSKVHQYNRKNKLTTIGVNTKQIAKEKNLIKKGVYTLLIGYRFKSAIKEYCKDEIFDLVIYVTPPNSFARVVKYLKRAKNIKTYLLLKDIFPQNALDIGLLPTWGPWKLLLSCFKYQERQLYKLADYIGCMSQRNVSYLLEHNPFLSKDRIEVCPNAINPIERNLLSKRIKSEGEPIVFLYGGNLGKPQGIPFLIECLKENIDKPDRIFIVCGSGTESALIESFIEKYKPINTTYIPWLPKTEYEELVSKCDVGMIFLDHRFTIPNFPSRILSYMEKAIPVLACTDKSTDMGEIITQGAFGWWCESKKVEEFTTLVDKICSMEPEQLCKYGENARAYLENHYTVEQAYYTIMKHFE